MYLYAVGPSKPIYEYFYVLARPHTYMQDREEIMAIRAFPLGDPTVLRLIPQTITVLLIILDSLCFE